jgi:hypothetical protein
VTGSTAVPRGLGLKGRAVITRVRLALPKSWQPDLGYLDLQRKQAEKGIEQPTRSRSLNGSARSAVPSCRTPKSSAMRAASSRTPR